ARREDAERAMAALGESERALVVLHFGHGVGYPELADAFGIGQGAARMRVSRALARMRDALRDDDDRPTGRHVAVVAGAEASGAFARVDGYVADAPDDLDEVARSFDAELDLDHDLDLDADLDAATSWAVHEESGEPTFEALRDDVPSALWSQLAW